MAPSRIVTLLASLLLATSLTSLPAAFAQADPGGRISVTYRDGNAQAALVSVPDGEVLFDGADIPVDDPNVMVIGQYAWDLAPDGSAMLLHRLTIASMTGELVRRDLDTGEETVVMPPEGTQLIASTARLDAAGDRVLFQYVADDAEDPRNLLLGLWQNGASLPLAGEPSFGIVAFALAPNGTFAYVALPLAEEGAAPEIFAGSLGGGDPERVGTLSTDAPLVLNPSATSMTISADGARIALSTPERVEPMTAVPTRSFAIDLSTGDTSAYPADGFGLTDASISPDGARVVLVDPDHRQLMIAEVADPASLRPLGAPLQASLGEPVAWSPESTHIAYGDVGPAGYQAHVRSVDGGDPVQVTSFDEGLWNSAIRWVE